jgi:hypothetical protein
MIRTVSAQFGNLPTDLWPQVSTWTNKDCNELAHCLRALNAWRTGYFEPKYGGLTALEHRSKGDDPPDVVSVFTGGRCSMEHTEIEPEHRQAAHGVLNSMWKQAQKTGAPMPLSRVIPASEVVPKGGLLNAMLPSGMHEWTDFHSEIYGLMNIVVQRADEKILGARGSSVIVMQGGLLTPTFDAEWQMVVDAHKWAFARIQSINEWEKHAYITLYDILRDGRFFTSFYSKSTGFSWGFADPGTNAGQMPGLH